MQKYYYIRALKQILRMTAGTFNKAVMRITHAMSGSTEVQFWLQTNSTFVLR